MRVCVFFLGILVNCTFSCLVCFFLLPKPGYIVPSGQYIIKFTLSHLEQSTIWL